MNGLTVLGLWTAAAVVIAVVAGWAPLAVWLETHEKLAAWAQAVGSIAAIAVGAAAVRWQVTRQASEHKRAIRDEEIRKMKVVGAALFHCRVAVETMQNMHSSSIGLELTQLRSQLEGLKQIPALDFPDWRVLHGVASAADTLAIHFERIRSGDAAPASLRSITVREHYLSVVLHALEFAEELTQDALKARDSDLEPISMLIDGKKIISRSYPLERPDHHAALR